MPGPAAFSRRALLRAMAGGAGAAMLSGCTSSSPHPPTSTATGAPPPSTASLTTPSATNSRPPWAALQARMTGRLYHSGDPGYDRARLTANPRYDLLRPAAVARCQSPADVAACVAFARDASVPFTIRAGGHSYTASSTGPQLVVDVSAMNQVQVDPLSGRVRLGAGARLVDVYTAVAGAGRAIAAGSCPSVGATGLTLGGGVGVLARAWGLTCDALVSYDMVTAEAAVHTVDESGSADLLWAGRGGGGGSFGVVTELTLHTQAAPDVTIFSMFWPWSAASDVVQAWQHWAPVADARCWSTCKIQAGPGSAPTVLVAGVWSGADASLGAVLAPLLRSVGTGTVWRGSSRHRYLDAMLIEAGCKGSSCHLPPAGTLVRELLAATSHVPATLMSTTAVDALVGAVETASATAGLHLVTASLDALGGAVAARPEASSAFVHRSAPFTVQYTATWTRPTLPGGHFDAVVRSLRATMTPYLGNGAYTNYCDASIADWQNAYWGANYARLQSIKRAVDPHDLFNGPQSVRP